MTALVNFGILGAGMIAEYHRTAIIANADVGARLVAVGHHDPGRFEALSRIFGVPCSSQEDVLARADVDVVCICTPSGCHAAQTIAAAQAGKHVLVEKPMALTVADADAMIAACRSAGIQLGVMLQRRVEPVFQRVHRALAADAFGRLTLGIVTLPHHRPQSYYEQAAWRGTWALDGGGVLMNQGIHLLDLLLWFMGDPVDVRAVAGTLRWDIEVEDTLAAILRFAEGACATIGATTTTDPGFAPRLELYGAQGGVQIEGDVVRRWEAASSPGSEAGLPLSDAPVGAGAGGNPRGIAAIGHAAILRDFVESLRDQRPVSIGGVEGRRSVAAIEAIYDAAGLLPRSSPAA